ncbi:MAG: ATP synthase F1 subunit delta, partial [Deltaproteobacteria bacterium]
MIGGSLARRYARALLDIGREDGQVRRVLTEVEEFAKLLDASAGLREALEAAHVNRRDQAAALDAVLSRAGFLPSTKSFLSLLVDKGRMNVLLPILGELRRMVEELEGVERVEVSVPTPMSSAQKDLLKGVLERRTGKQVVLEETVDPAVLGGFV